MAVVKGKGAWKRVEVDENILNQSDFQCFGGLEVLEDYEIHDINQHAYEGKKLRKGLKRKQLAEKDDGHSPAGGEGIVKKAKRKKSKKRRFQVDTAQAKEPEGSHIEDETAPDNSATRVDEAVPGDSATTFDDDASLLKVMSAWKDLFVPRPVLRALHDAGFFEPTLIQSLVLPSAIRDKKDILGAAETGSGKTLAFGIPLLHSILKMKSADQSHAGTAHDDGGRTNIADAENGDDTGQCEEAEDSDDLLQEEEKREEGEPCEGDPAASCRRVGIYALVLTPTRELAVQVRDHINKIAKYTDIKSIAIFGGMSSQKQERLLRRQPEIVVGTPGRLWELYEQGNPHMSTISAAPLVVIDEADRMVEKGHFEELAKMFAMINESKSGQSRQTLVFSATLTYVHDLPSRLKTKRKKFKLDREHKLAGLIETLGMNSKPKIVDVTRPSQTAQTLLETRILCTTEEKDVYLYYFLQQHPGRTIVFANSIDSIRRLVSIFTLLRCAPLPLHSEMHQKQRLKNLERFASNPGALLLATDVAARGLDISNIDHVVHFQVPRTCESYIHRSGRTARALKEGLSLMLIDANGMPSYRKLIKSINKGEDIAMFPVEQDLLHGYKERVDLARQIDITEHRLIKKKKTDDWFVKAAEEADIVLDDVDQSDDDGEADAVDARMRNKLRGVKQNLDELLRAPVNINRFRGKYPTQSGKLVLPAALAGQGSSKKSAISMIKRKGNRARSSAD